MVYSMTAFARRIEEYGWGSVILEIRSLNHRYLDIHIDIPKHFLCLLRSFREKIKNCLVRGKIECNFQIKFNDDHEDFFVIDKRLVRCLVSSTQWLRTQVDMGEINPLDILLYPGVILCQKSNVDNNVHADLINCLESVLKDLVQDRLREGLFLKDCILHRLQRICEDVNKIKEYVPDVLESRRRNLLKKMKDIADCVDITRLEQELLIIIQRVDISEEIDRLTSHVDEIYKILSDMGPIGRRLDFLIQESYREVNTLSSKSINTNITQLAISLKVYIEQIREQIQNIE